MTQPSAAPPPFDPSVFAESVKQAWKDYAVRTKGRKGVNHDYVYASAYTPCTRKMVMDMTHADQLPPFDPEVLAKFQRGDDREEALLADLRKIGRDSDPPFKVIGQQERFELRDRKGRVAITGKTDAAIDFGYHHPLTPRLEAKSWHPNVTQRIETFEDLFKYRWTAKGAYQLLAYLLGSGEPFGFLLLDKPGLPDLIPVELYKHLDLAEEFLQRAEDALDHKEAGTLPPFIDDPDECAFCPHFAVNCQPPNKHEGASVILDDELAAMLDERESLLPQVRRYKALDRRVKKDLAHVENALCGNFHVEGAIVERKGYTVEPCEYRKLKFTKISKEN